MFLQNIIDDAVLMRTEKGGGEGRRKNYMQEVGKKKIQISFFFLRLFSSCNRGKEENVREKKIIK